MSLFAQMTGDWNGYRERAREKGVDITASYANDLVGNPIFTALLFATPSDQNRFPFFFTAGIVYKGIVPGRVDDSLSMGVAYGAYSKFLRPKASAETVLELNYWAWINKWMAITPDVQYILRAARFLNFWRLDFAGLVALRRLEANLESLRKRAMR